MSTAKRSSTRRYLRKPVIAPRAPLQVTARPTPTPVLIRTVAFQPAYLRKRVH